MNTPIAALTEQLRTRFTATAELWGNNAYQDKAPDSANPTIGYMVFQYLAGGEINQIKTEDAELIYGIRGVSTKPEEAEQMAVRINALLNDAENSAPFTDADGWHVASVTGKQAIHLIQDEDSNRIYHEGKQYVFRMEAV
jgi:hypothetical protein